MSLSDFFQGRRNLVIAVVVVAIAAVTAWSFIFQASPVGLPNKMPLVCVATGETFNISRERINMLPMENPKTGERTLVPYETREGKRYVPSRYRFTVEDLQEKNQHVDLETLAVKSDD